ncbi:YpoC family protein [Macrococcus equi]|uniref:YpoC family protein n=1 Tax=Macrococcus equi TaxID=3395462 RepID=UPI0039BEC43C
MKEHIQSLEKLIEEHSANRTLKSDAAKKLLDAYYDHIIILMNLLNDITDKNILEDNYEISPLNFNERIQYIEARKHHYMGYQQMKTMYTEIFKLVSIQNIKKKR